MAKHQVPWADGESGDAVPARVQDAKGPEWGRDEHRLQAEGHRKVCEPERQSWTRQPPGKTPSLCQDHLQNPDTKSTDSICLLVKSCVSGLP